MSVENGYVPHLPKNLKNKRPDKNVIGKCKQKTKTKAWMSILI